MTTQVVLDDQMIEEGLRMTGLGTQQELLALALAELIRSRSKKNLLDLAGEIRFREGFDHKALRELGG
jgi:Arc/MetJ family transcription regulator